MPAPMKDITRQRFGKLVALAYVGKWKKSRRALWDFVCDCGNTKKVLLQNVTTGQVKSCGCIVATSAGLTQTERYTYTSYSAMIRRCTDPAYFRYPDYGGRGIHIYFDWLPEGGFKNFLRDMGPRPQGTTIDRIRVNGNYEPGNCQWATAKEQRMNQRRMQNEV